jgi:hypothetical protein
MVFWSRQTEKARAVASDLGIAAVADRWEQIVESPDIDTVIIATPPIMHSMVTVAALSAGKHVLCQVRMARNFKEARAMLQAARSSELVAALYPSRPGLKRDRVMRRQGSYPSLGSATLPGSRRCQFHFTGAAKASPLGYISPGGTETKQHCST